VLTLCAAQVRCIRAALAAAGLRGVSVSTVDGSQGAEADVVLLSFVRANARGAVGFAAG
jgi:superfamily I DNA and/or RNA helicase